MINSVTGKPESYKKRRRRIINCLKKNPDWLQADIARHLGLTRWAVAWHLKKAGLKPRRRRGNRCAICVKPIRPEITVHPGACYQKYYLSIYHCKHCGREGPRNRKVLRSNRNKGRSEFCTQACYYTFRRINKKPRQPAGSGRKKRVDKLLQRW